MKLLRPKQGTAAVLTQSPRNSVAKTSCKMLLASSEGWLGLLALWLGGGFETPACEMPHADFALVPINGSQSLQLSMRGTGLGTVYQNGCVPHVILQLVLQV